MNFTINLINFLLTFPRFTPQIPQSRDTSVGISLAPSAPRPLSGDRPSRPRLRPSYLSTASIMYSNPNSFLGGNAMRPGAPQYGSSFGAGAGQPQQQQQQPSQSQPSPFAPQPTGFAQAPLQQQYTGYPGLQPPQGPGQLQPQFTGFGQTLQQSAMPPMPAIPQQYQQQFQQQQHQQQQQQPTPFAAAPTQSAPQTLLPPPPPVKPQATGYSEMAASFHAAGGAKPRPSAAPRQTNKVPNIRLSFITAPDQAKFETLFKSALGDGQTTMSGEKARDLLLRSRLDGDSLSHIW